MSRAFLVGEANLFSSLHLSWGCAGPVRWFVNGREVAIATKFAGVTERVQWEWLSDRAAELGAKTQRCKDVLKGAKQQALAA